MKLYLTFPSGMENFIQNYLEKNNLATNITALKGALFCNSNKNISTLSNLSFINNCFIVIKDWQEKKLSFISMIKSLEKNINQSLLKVCTQKSSTFCTKFLDNNQFAKVDTMLKVRAEKNIKQITNQKLSIANANSEFWFISRTDCSLMALLVSKNLQTKEDAGELKSEIACAMVEIANISKNDVVYDPFCGYGGIVKPLVKSSAQKVYASDIETNLIKQLSIKMKFPQLKIFKCDYFKEISLKDSITKIITDPPWAQFDKSINAKKFLEDMLTKSYELLKKGGEIVFLSFRDNQFATYMPAKYAFSIKEQHYILVNGKKATIYKLKKGYVAINN